MDSSLSPSQKKFGEWQAYVLAHPGCSWELGKAYDQQRGWCPMWKVGDKAMTFTVGDARVYLKHSREGLTAKLAEMDEATRATVEPEKLLAWFGDFEACVLQCLKLNEQGAVPKALGGTYEEPLCEFTDEARLMASLRPDGGEGDPEALDRANIEALANANDRDQIRAVSVSVCEFMARMCDGGIDDRSVLAGVNLAFVLGVMGGPLGEGASDEDVLDFVLGGSKLALKLARDMIALFAQEQKSPVGGRLDA